MYVEPVCEENSARSVDKVRSRCEGTPAHSLGGCRVGVSGGRGTQHVFRTSQRAMRVRY